VDRLNIAATEEWRAAQPGAVIGLLELSGVDNRAAVDNLNARKRQIEARLRERYGNFTRKDLLALPVLAAYGRYYKRFEKTYHVQLQLESLALKGRNLPDVSPLVDASFMAEVETFILTAGHDALKLQGEVYMDVSRPDDQMTQMNGTTRTIRAGDMIMRDDGGICCSIIYGQDNRSPISPATTHALYVAYAPAGVPAESVEAHLRCIEENIRLFSPAAQVEQLCLLEAGG